MVKTKKHDYIRYRIGRLKHQYWLYNRKRPEQYTIDQYDWYIINNLKPGKTCVYGSAGYYLEPVISNLTVIERYPIVLDFYPSAQIVSHRSKIEGTYDNFVVVNNRGDIWCTLDTVDDHISHYVKTMNDGALFFYSFRDTQIVNWNRLTIDHYDYFYNFAMHIEKKYNLNLLWHDIQFATKEKDGAGNYDILENPDTTNGNIKFVFQYKERSHKLNLEYLHG
jgi:hypothetical protein